jgi:dTDP-4-dehydrorhamnose reductase
MKSVVVLGPNGMLGQMVVSYFQRQGFSVLKFEERFTFENKNIFIEKLNQLEAGIIINCIGLIKQKNNNSADLIWANSVLPLELSGSLKQEHLLVHPSTDCVFDGENNKSPFELNSKLNANDSYGYSKILGEFAVSNRPNTLIMRVSIIGPDRISNKGLLSWFLNEEKKCINGFTNHFWNGITTLEWCKIVHNELSNYSYLSNKLIQPGTVEFHSKFQMLMLFRKIFNKNIKIIECETPQTIDRRLSPTIICKSLEEQLVELKNY